MPFLLWFLSLLLLIQLALRRSNNFRTEQGHPKAHLPMICKLAHVPSYLHWDRETVFNKFFHNEELYWRRSKADIEKENPFLSITLADVSVNRSGNNEVFFSKPQDVLINIENTNETHYSGYGVFILSVNKIDFDKESKKSFTEIDTNGQMYIVEMHLIHDPIDCNKAHSMFRFKFDSQFVKFDEYKNSLGKDLPKVLKKLRKCCKDELQKMIVSRIVEF